MQIKQIFRKYVLLLNALIIVAVVGIVITSQSKSQADANFLASKRPNQQPVAQAGLDQTVNVGVLSTSLDGSKSTDVDGDSLNYFWTEIADTFDGCSITDFTAKQPAITLLQKDQKYTCTFQLTVDDGQVESDADQVTLFVSSNNDSTTPTL